MTPLHFDVTVDYSTVQFPSSAAHTTLPKHLMAFLVTTVHHLAGSNVEMQ